MGFIDFIFSGLVGEDTDQRGQLILLVAEDSNQGGIELGASICPGELGNFTSKVLILPRSNLSLFSLLKLVCDLRIRDNLENIGDNLSLR